MGGAVEKENGGEGWDQPDLTDKRTGTTKGIPAGSAQEDSPGSYGGTDRLTTETGPVKGNEKDKAKDI